MRIAHVCLSNWYIEGLAYQENELISQHVQSGHEVLVIASTEVLQNGKLAYARPGDFLGPEGARVIRLAYRCWPPKLARKLRIHSGVYRLLEEFRADAILFHGTCGWEVATAARYARDNPHVLFYIDSHEDHYNSARGFVSREILHKLYYRFCLSRAWPHARKILCVSAETMTFVDETYRVPRAKLEFYPLGGRPIPTDQYITRRAAARSRLGIGGGEILLIQSGKQTKRKKLLESLRAFASAAPPNARLKIVGMLDDDIKDEASQLIMENPAVEFLGWRNADELTDILCAADIYLQPGTQSVTMQHSLCCHCAIIIDDVPSHSVYVDDNGWLLNSRMPLEQVFREIEDADIAQMQKKSFALACKMLNYLYLAERVLRR